MLGLGDPVRVEVWTLGEARRPELGDKLCTRCFKHKVGTGGHKALPAASACDWHFGSLTCKIVRPIHRVGTLKLWA